MGYSYAIKDTPLRNGGFEKQNRRSLYIGGLDKLRPFYGTRRRRKRP